MTRWPRPTPSGRHAPSRRGRPASARSGAGIPSPRDPERLATLADFCAWLGRDPDALVAHCFLRRRGTGERFASVRRREEVAGWIRAYLDARGYEGAERRRRANAILSFLIHNGVQMNPRAVE